MVDACEEAAGACERAVGGEQGCAELSQRSLQRRGGGGQPLPLQPGSVCERRLTGTAFRQPAREPAAVTALGP